MYVRLSESLRRGIMKAGAGGIINRFKARERRDVLFFEDILARYIKECEEAGHGRDMEEIGRKWMNLVITNLFPRAVIRMPIQLLFPIAKSIWTNLGLMEDLHVMRRGETITIFTSGEHTTRIIGKNSFVVGAFAGILNVMTDHEVEPTSVIQTKESSKYVFLIKEDKWKRPDSKSTGEYERLNNIKADGLSMKVAIKRGILRISDKNRLYFRNRSVIPIENTLFHVFGDAGILMEGVSRISYEHFRNFVEDGAGEDNKLLLLKNMLQIMGWGMVIITDSGKRVAISIERPPYGLQAGKDDWSMIAMIILGFLQTINRGFRMIGTKHLEKRFLIIYSRPMAAR